MSTIYTLNGKVLKNAANDKWLAKKEAPAGFVMDASNATINGNFIYWQSPSYPNGYDGNGKSYTVVNNYSGDVSIITGLMYISSNVSSGGPTAIPVSDMVTGSGTLGANLAGTASGFGMYLGFPTTVAGGRSPTEAELLEFVSNITITILDA